MQELYELLKPYIFRHKKHFIFLNITILIAAISQTLIPLSISYIIDNIVPTGDTDLLFIGFLVLIGLAIFDMLGNMGQRFASVRVAQNVIYDIRQDLFETLQYQELEFYAKETVGQIMSRSIEEVFSLRDILTWGYRISMMVILLFLGALIAMLQLGVTSYLNKGNKGPFLLAVVFLVIPVVILYVVQLSSERNRDIFYDARYKYAEMNDTLAENLSGIQTVKSFGREQEQIQEFNTKNQNFFNAALKGAWVRGTMQPGVIFIISTALIFLVFIGGGLVSVGSITAGNFIAFMLLVLQIAVPGRFVGWVGIILQDSNSAAIRLNEIFDAPVEIKEEEDAKSLENVDGEISFDQVSFSYPSAHHGLHDIDLTVKEGQKVALLGPTGAGKSTLINLIPRFFDPQDGEVKIDGKDIKKFTLETLRKHIGIVHQEAFLFTLSIHDNIAFANPDADRAAVIEAAKSAQIHDYIMTLEDGYDTIVGERGVTLSGGQRQRVTIARTLLKNPKILIFDDSVSAVDPETEARIQESLERASFARTTIIISQRPSSLRYVDRIIVLDKGRIVQDGKHTDLIKQDGIYREFIEAVDTQVQFMDWDLEEGRREVEMEAD